MSNTIIYNDGELELKVSIENETVWLTQKQLGDLFDVEVNTINYHIKNIFKQKELDKNPTIRKIRIVQKEGNREVERDVEHYNLDMAISLGYRVNSITATKFRKWATSVLKRYIQNGYSINTQKITNERFVSLENEVIDLKSKIVKIDSLIKNNTLELKQGIFYNGQIFDAYVFISDLIKKSKKSIILIDNYIDDSTLTLFSKNLDINILIYTQTISKKLKLDLEKYNKQYKNLNVKTTKNFHDRFMIIDNEKVFHIGASLKDLGSKTFAFTQINLNHEDILDNL
ncbi:virulence RhuM family protein [Poseidonibacter lekithochrous]|uniref:virulence RhuM family protein n=1 Tax=Poseidonibacter TaxID=2321187 RepID=UPI001C09F07C|nr:MULTISPECIES: RhuM family protein [Poseidonibacter]MBU3013267.1 virulence RhuM family protein [Poseidonibacter lekithochrous]MDO6826564.1 RhuM family protein [Poseidonibacter sp. 1_MG-2023]